MYEHNYVCKNSNKIHPNYIDQKSLKSTAGIVTSLSDGRFFAWKSFAPEKRDNKIHKYINEEISHCEKQTVSISLSTYSRKY